MIQKKLEREIIMRFSSSFSYFYSCSSIYICNIVASDFIIFYLQKEHGEIRGKRIEGTQLYKSSLTMASPSQERHSFQALLLESIDPSAKETLALHGCEVESLSTSLPHQELIKKIQNVHILGIRSKTTVSEEVLQAAPHLLAIGCFCIGTNQVDLIAARRRGVAVFNSPFANTRSVAELTIGEIICLSRQLTQRCQEVHQGSWKKTHLGSYEVRGKTLGVIGYGHIGSQVGVLAESLGMRVHFFDVIPKLSLGNTTRMNSMEDVLRHSDFVTVHVPELETTKNLIQSHHFAMMKKGSYFLNLSRGTVVDLDALAEAIKTEHLAGAGVDVYPVEPGSPKERLVTPLQNLPNVILTPHIGGSTCEAQAAIGKEVSQALAVYLSTGSTAGSVNMPQVGPPPLAAGYTRLANAHWNTPGALNEITGIVASSGCNITFQFLNTSGDVGYLVMDVEREASEEVEMRISSLKRSIRTRMIH